MQSNQGDVHWKGVTPWRSPGELGNCDHVSSLDRETAQLRSSRLPTTASTPVLCIADTTPPIPSSTLHTLPTTLWLFPDLRISKMSATMTTGMLGEGKYSGVPGQAWSLPLIDGIHVDMNHLKKGEVK